MEPVAVVKLRCRKGWRIVHRCVVCGMQRSNQLAQNTVAPDDLDMVMRLVGERSRLPRPVTRRGRADRFRSARRPTAAVRPLYRQMAVTKPTAVRPPRAKMSTS